jgi:hypothetical protein
VLHTEKRAPAEIGPGKVGARMLSRTSRNNVLLRAAVLPTRADVPIGPSVLLALRPCAKAASRSCLGYAGLLIPYLPRGSYGQPLLSRVRVTEFRWHFLSLRRRSRPLW